MTIRIWNNDLSVVIGRAQLARFETDVNHCLDRGIPIVRRFTGGGAVYHGPGNLNWSLALGRAFAGRRIRYAWDARAAFRQSASLVTAALEECGRETWFEEKTNRILSAKGKVSGMAAYLSRDGMFCHGTLLLAADLEAVSRLTRPSAEAPHGKYARSSPTEVANLEVKEEEFVASLISVVSEEVSVALERGEPSEPEMRSVRDTLSRYTDPDWNLGDPFDARWRRE